VDVQELALVSFPGQGRWPLQLCVALLVFVVMAVILALTGFLVVDHATWLLVWLFLRRSIDDSRTRYAAEQKFYELEILRVVEGQMFGLWKLWRLMVGAIIVIAADVFAFQSSISRGCRKALFRSSAHGFRP
jgi:hypothetical protein